MTNKTPIGAKKGLQQYQTRKLQSGLLPFFRRLHKSPTMVCIWNSSILH